MPSIKMTCPWYPMVSKASIDGHTSYEESANLTHRKTGSLPDSASVECPSNVHRNIIPSTLENSFPKVVKEIQLIKLVQGKK